MTIYDYTRIKCHVLEFIEPFLKKVTPGLQNHDSVASANHDFPSTASGEQALVAACGFICLLWHGLVLCNRDNQHLQLLSEQLGWVKSFACLKGRFYRKPQVFTFKYIFSCRFFASTNSGINGIQHRPIGYQWSSSPSASPRSKDLYWITWFSMWNDVVQGWCINWTLYQDIFNPAHFHVLDSFLEVAACFTT